MIICLRLGHSTTGRWGSPMVHACTFNFTLHCTGPYWCAQDNIAVTYSACTTAPGLISVSKLVAITYTTALSLTIDPPSHLKASRVYLFSGTLDSVVVPGGCASLSRPHPLPALLVWMYMCTCIAYTLYGTVLTGVLNSVEPGTSNRDTFSCPL